MTDAGESGGAAVDILLPKTRWFLVPIAGVCQFRMRLRPGQPRIESNKTPLGPHVTSCSTYIIDFLLKSSSSHTLKKVK